MKSYKNIAFTVILLFILGSGFSYFIAWGHGGHGDEEAEKLGGTTTPLSTGTLFTTLSETNLDSLSIPTYPGIVLSDEYGSIFSERVGTVGQIYVNVGDNVKKGQKVAFIQTPANTPEMISLIASQKAEISIAQGEIKSANEKYNYLEKVIGDPDNAIKNAFDVKRKAVNIQYDVEKKLLENKIIGLRANLKAKGMVVSSVQTTSNANIEEALQKKETEKNILVGKFNKAYADTLRILYAGDVVNLNNNNDSTYRNFYWAKDNIKWGDFGNINQESVGEIPRRIHENMQSLMPYYPSKSDIPLEQLKSNLQILETILNDTNDAFAVISPFDAPNYEVNKKALIDLLVGDGGILVIQSEIIALEKSAVSISAAGSGAISEIQVELLIIEQEIQSLETQKETLVIEEQRELANIDGDQSITNIDLEKLKIDAQTEKISAENKFQAMKEGLASIQGVVQGQNVYAPFNGIIARKNVSIGQNIDVSTPLFDIAGNSGKTKNFIRFEVPVTDFSHIQKGQKFSVFFPGLQESLGSVEIIRLAASVDKETQTFSIEADIGDIELPIGTQLRGEQLLGEAKIFIEIPQTSVKQEDGKSYVFKVLPDNTLKKWEVQYELIVGKYIVTSGLKVENIIATDIEDKQWQEGKNVEQFLLSNK